MTIRQGFLEESETVPGTRPKADNLKDRYVRQVLLTRIGGKVFFTDWIIQYLHEDNGWAYHEGLFVRTAVNDIDGLAVAARDKILLMLSSYPTRAEGIAAVHELVDGITGEEIDRVKSAVKRVVEGSP